MASSITARYAAGVAAGRVERNVAQLAVVDMLARLVARIVEYRLARKSSSLGWLFGSRESREPRIKGLYLYGDVGRGKTMLMDLLFAASPVVRKRRTHFHEIMIDVHERVHAFRQKMKRGEHAGKDPIQLAAIELAQQAWLRLTSRGRTVPPIRDYPARPPVSWRPEQRLDRSERRVRLERGCRKG